MRATVAHRWQSSANAGGECWTEKASYIIEFYILEFYIPVKGLRALADEALRRLGVEKPPQRALSGLTAPEPQHRCLPVDASP
jgi:hypothetical protein